MCKKSIKISCEYTLFSPINGFNWYENLIFDEKNEKNDFFSVLQVIYAFLRKNTCFCPLCPTNAQKRAQKWPYFHQYKGYGSRN